MRRFQSRIVDANNNLVSAGNVTVEKAGTSILAALFSGEGLVALPNPVKSDHVGVYEFYVESGDYDISLSDPVTGFSRKFYDVSIFDVRDVAVLKSGSTMQGPLVLSGDATAALHPMSKQQVDSLTSGDMAGNARVGVRLQSAGSTSKRRRLNLISGAGIALTVADDSVNEEVDVTIDTVAGGGAPLGSQYVVMALDGSLTAERRLFSGDNIKITDGGANADVTLESLVGVRKQSATPAFRRKHLNLMSGGLLTLVVADDAGSDEVDVTYDAATGTPVGLGNAAAEGTAGSVARSDHVHKRDVRVARHGTDIGTRNRLNLISGGNIVLTVADDAANDEVDVTIDAVGGGGAPVGSQYVVMALDGTLTAERRLFSGDNIKITDGGANADVTLESLVAVRKQSATAAFRRKHLNLISAGNISLTVEDDAGNDEVDVTIDMRVPAVRAKRTTAQTTTSGAFASINFNAADDFDTDNLHDTVVGNNKLHCILPGVYFIYGAGAFVGNVTGTRLHRLVRAPSEELVRSQFPGTSQGPSFPASTVMSLASGDTIMYEVFQDSGGDLDYGGVSADVTNTIFAMYRVRGPV